MKTVTEMAREAGLVYLANGLFWMDAGEPGDELERLVELARADEREACAKVCEKQNGAGPEYENWWEFSDAIRARSNT